MWGNTRGPRSHGINYKKDIFPWKKFMENSIPLSPQKISNSIFFLKKRVKITVTEVIIKLLQVPWKISVIPWFSEKKKGGLWFYQSLKIEWQEISRGVHQWIRTYLQILRRVICHHWPTQKLNKNWWEKGGASAMEGRGPWSEFLQVYAFWRSSK